MTRKYKKDLPLKIGRPGCPDGFVPVHQARALVLSALGMSITDIAGATGVSKQAISKKIRDGLTQLGDNIPLGVVTGLDRLWKLIPTGLEAVEAILKDPKASPNVKLQAFQLVLDRTIGMMERAQKNAQAATASKTAQVMPGVILSFEELKREMEDGAGRILAAKEQATKDEQARRAAGQAEPIEAEYTIEHSTPTEQCSIADKNSPESKTGKSQEPMGESRTDPPPRDESRYLPPSIIPDAEDG